MRAHAASKALLPLLGYAFLSAPLVGDEFSIHSLSFSPFSFLIHFLDTLPSPSLALSRIAKPIIAMFICVPYEPSHGKFHWDDCSYYPGKKFTSTYLALKTTSSTQHYNNCWPHFLGYSWNNL